MNLEMASISSNFTNFMGGYLTEDTENQTAVMVALINRDQPEEKVVEYLAELAFLAETLSLDVVKSFTQRLDRPEVRTFLGKGKLEEVKTYIQA
ncbi:MAG: GTP-binding protein HflX, partial [Roseivirga sp.]